LRSEIITFPVNLMSSLPLFMKKIILSIIIFFPYLVTAQLKINEIMPDNVSAVIDDSYNYSMWVELFNPSTSSSYDQSQFYFTDDLTYPKKWKPAYKLIPPGSFSVLWFEREERSGHASFKLNPEGGKLYLLSINSVKIDSVIYPAQIRNVSYGRKINNGSEWTFFEQFSPGTTNNNKFWATVQCSKPKFELKNGFYKTVQSLSFATPESGDSIYFTTDGSEPTRKSIYYIPGSKSQISFTRCYRAKTFAKNKLSSDISTSTYFIGERNFQLPVVSIVTSQKNLTDNTTGIYVAGTNGLTGNGMNTPANWNQDWDRPVNFELFDTTNVARLNQELDISISGGWSRMNNQKSLKISPRKKFGDNQLQYDIFASTKPNHKYKGIQLRNSGNDFYYSMMRDAFMQSIVMKRMDLDCSAYEPAICFMNGVYYGIQNLRERSSEDLVYSNYGLESEDIKMSESWAIPYDTSYIPLSDYISKNDITQPVVYTKVCQMMDVDNFANYMISEIYFANTDWPANNVKIWKKKSGGKWRWILYDTDFGMNLYDTNLQNHNTLLYALGEKTDQIPDAWSTLLLRRLILNETFRNKFIDRFCIQLSTTFETTRVNHIMDSLARKISGEITFHKIKWDSYRGFSDDLNNMKVFTAYRPGNLMNFISGRFMNASVTQTAHLTSNIINAVYSMNNEQVIGSDVLLKYFKNRSVAFEAKSVSGYKFKQWELTSTTGQTLQIFTDPVYKTILTANINLKAVYELSGMPEPLEGAGVTMNELVASNNLISDEYGDKDDYIEIYNYGTSEVNIAGWYLTDTPSNPTLARIPLTDSLKTNIPPKGRIVLWADNQPLQGSLHVGFKLGKEGETIVLSKTATSGLIVTVDSVSYPLMEQNMSYSRVPDGSINWIIQGTTLNKTNDNLSAIELPYMTPQLYPTVVKESITVQNALGNKLVISDLAGKIIYINECNSDTETFNVAFLQSGMYIVSVGKSTYKIVKL